MRDYRYLPASVNPDEANSLFEEFLENHAADKQAKYEDIHNLVTLSYLQADTFELVYPQTAKKIEEYLFRIMDLERSELAIGILTIALTLGLVSVFRYIYTELKNIQAPGLREQLEMLIERDGTHPEDPYYDYTHPRNIENL